MPSKYRCIFDKINYDLVLMESKVTQELTEGQLFSDTLVNSIKSMEILHLSKEAKTRLIVELVRRINGFSLKTQKIVLQNIINYHNSPQTSLIVENFEKKLRDFDNKTGKSNEDISIEILNNLISKENNVFFGFPEYICLYEELYLRIEDFLATIFRVSDLSIEDGINKMTFPNFSKNTEKKIIDDCLTLVRTMSYSKEITVIFLLNTIKSQKEERLKFIDSYVSRTTEKPLKTKIEKKIIEDFFVTDGFFTS